MSPDALQSVCAITGANGYLGSQLRRTFEKKGWTVYSFIRTAGAADRTVPYALDHPVDPDAFRSRHINVLIHCAYDVAPKSWEQIRTINVLGSIRLFEAAKAGGVKKIIFISSTSAHDTTRSLYGKAKLEIERVVLKLGGEVVRPGLLYSDALEGLMGKIQKMAASTPILPVLAHSNRPLYLAHIEDVAELVFYLATHESTGQHLWVAASSKGWTLAQIVKHIAQSRNKKVLVVPVPWQVAWLGLKTLESVGLTLSFRSDSVLGLVYASAEAPQSAASPVSFRSYGSRS